MEQLPVYLDHAATTPVHPDVLAAMLPYWRTAPGNPSSIYGWGREARHALDSARDTVAQVLHCRPREVIFTSGGTEADNAALQGAAFANFDRGNHLITCAIEHHAILHTCEFLEQFGFETTVLPVDRYGQVDPGAVAAAIRPETVLVSIMYANNEVGTIQPIRDIARVAHERGVLVHTDAVQAGGVLSLDVNSLGVDLLSLAGHKFYGPKGTGVLYVREGAEWQPQQQGGSQERNQRAGTENTAGIVGLAKALDLAHAQLAARRAHDQHLRDRLISGLLTDIPDARLTGHPTNRLPNSASFCFHNVEGESILLGLDVKSIYASSGSACTSGSLELSHVLEALGLPAEWARGSLRLTVGLDNTEAQIDYVLRELPALIETLRAMAPPTTPLAAAS